MIKKKQCVIGKRCTKHGFVHGAEAQELRDRLEEVIKLIELDGEQEASEWVRDILDDVDARDSAAYLEADDRRGPRARAPSARRG